MCASTAKVLNQYFQQCYETFGKYQEWRRKYFLDKKNGLEVAIN